MAERAIFLDRDNTIIDNDGYLGDASKVKLLQGAATAIAAVRRLGYRIVVVSNQSGVARGMFNEAAVEAVNQEMCRQLREQAGAHIDASYYCPYHPEAVVAEYKLDHDWRKPKPGMLKQAAEDFGLDLPQCWMIGDAPRDIAAGASAGCRTILLRDPDHPAADGDASATAVSPNYIVKTLADAARIIAREGRNPHYDLVPKPLNVPIAEPIPTPAPPASGNTPAQPTPEIINPVTIAAPVSDHLVERLEKAVAVGLSRHESVKPTLEEILIHLRQQARVRESPEFSMGKLLAMIAQFLALLCLLLGAYEGIATFSTGAAGTMDFWNHMLFLQDRNMALQGAGLWLLAAVVLQGLVLALHRWRR